MLFDGRQSRRFIQVERVANEYVRVLGLNAVWGQRFLREVPEIASHDYVGSADDRCGQHVSVVRVRQIQLPGKRLVARYETVLHGCIHEVARSFKLSHQLGTPPQHRIHPFGVNLG